MKQRIIKLVYIYIAQLKYKNTFIALNDILKRWVIKSSTHIGSGRNTFLTEIEENYCTGACNSQLLVVIHLIAAI